ncbi:MAG: hypothetical protein RIR70_125 [Pseudomonadota bacterium]|jgi:uncharacterized membrane protein
MLERHPAEDGIVLIARRNCALSPRQLGRAFVAIAVLSLVIATGCVLIGAWVVLPWSLLEITAVAVAFLVWGRHANDRECIHVGRGQLLVEVHRGMRVARHVFNPQWVQLVTEPVRLPGASTRLVLRGDGQELEVGCHLDEVGRQSLARELRAALAQWR